MLPFFLFGAAVAQSILSDPGTFGPTPEIVHLYYDEWPTGIAVSSTGRMFSNYPPALDPNDQAYTVAELFNNTEKAYPNAEINSPPGGRINSTAYPPTSVGDPDHFVGVQSVVIDSKDRLWVLDTGRTANANGTMLPAAYGGPKLVGIDLSSNEIVQKIIFDPTAAPPDSYLNDVRFDLSTNTAYITDSSSEGRNAIVVVDLNAGTAFRRLLNLPSVSASQGFVPTVWGTSVYSNGTTGMPIGNVNFGADGIAISPDGTTLYWSTTGGRELYSIPTVRLRDQSEYAEILAQASVQFLTGKGLSDGLESDSNGLVYCGNIEANAISTYDPTTGILSTFTRDPRYSWTDTMSIATDGYLYFTENQLWLGPGYQGGVDQRQKPYVLFRVPLPNGGTKIGSSNSTM